LGADKSGLFFLGSKAFGPEQCLTPSLASLQFQLALPRRGGVLDLVGLNERGEQLLGLFGNSDVGEKPSSAGVSMACASVARFMLR